MKQSKTIILSVLSLCSLVACRREMNTSPGLNKLASATTTHLNLATPALTDITQWLTAHPTVAGAIKWQFQPGTSALYHTYDPTDSDKIAWANWSDAQKADLVNAFSAAYNWYFVNPAATDSIPTIPANQIGSNYSPAQVPVTYVAPTDAWQLYVRWIAHSLLVETYQLVPWSVTTYDAESLAILFDGSRIMHQTRIGYIMGFDNYNLEPNRRQVLGWTLIAPPIYTYNFLKNSQVIHPGTDPDKRTVIKNMLLWCKNNMDHFYNEWSFSNANATWQYLGPAPFARVAEGTTSLFGFSHWTAGCGGTSSFLRHALRAVNIPVQLANVCSENHYIPVFPTESVFMDHGDDAYNLNFKQYGTTPDVLLVDSSAFTTLFGQSFASTLNPQNADCENVGYTVINITASRFIDLSLMVGSATTGTFTVEVRSASGDSVLSSATVAASSLPVGSGWVKFKIAAPLTVGQQYRIYATRSDAHDYASGNYIFWRTSSPGTDAYPNGTNDAGQSGVTLDYAFRTYSAADGSVDQRQEQCDNNGFYTSSGLYLWQGFTAGR